MTKSIHLRPASLQDRQNIYDWLANSDITSSMLGPPDFTDNEIPTWEYFVNDYNPDFFNDDDPYQGRSYIIEHDGEAVGHINYNGFTRGNPVELDIWLAGSQYCNQGFGTKAIQMLCDQLHRDLGCREFILAPSARNERAVRAYEKIGYVRAHRIPDYVEPDYYDTVVMVKTVL